MYLSGWGGFTFAGAGFLLESEPPSENAEGLAAESKAKATIAEDGKVKKLNRMKRVGRRQKEDT